MKRAVRKHRPLFSRTPFTLLNFGLCRREPLFSAGIPGFFAPILWKVEVFAEPARQEFPCPGNCCRAIALRGISASVAFTHPAQNRWLTEPYSIPARGLK
jgi:hypothetical protein